MSLVSISKVDTYISYSQDTGDTYPQGQFYIDFLEDVVDNNSDMIDQVYGHHRITYENHRIMIFICTHVSTRSLISEHLTPTNNKRK